MLDQHSFELSNVKYNKLSDMITNESRIVERNLALTAKWCVINNISALKALEKGQIWAIEYKILHIGIPQPFVVTFEYKRTQKFSKKVTVGDETSAIILNIY